MLLEMAAFADFLVEQIALLRAGVEAASCRRWSPRVSSRRAAAASRDER